MPFPDLADSSEPDHNSAESSSQASPAHSSQPPPDGAPRSGQASDPESPKPPINTDSDDPLVDLPDPQPPPPEIPSQPNPRFILRRIFADWSQWLVIVLSAMVLGARGSTTWWLAIYGVSAAVEIFGLAFFGTTPSRWITGLRVESTSLNSISLWRSTLRHAVKQSPIIAVAALAALVPASAMQEAVIAGATNLIFLALSLFVFLPIVTGTDGQGQHDLIAETMTVGTRRSTSPAPLLERYRQSSRHLFENSALDESDGPLPAEDDTDSSSTRPDSNGPDDIPSHDTGPHNTAPRDNGPCGSGRHED